MSEIEKAIEQLNAELTDLVIIKESTFLLYGEKKKNLNDSISIRRIAVQALQEKLERENPKPLGLEELENMVGEPVWVDTMKQWRIVCIDCENNVRLYSVFNTVSAKNVFNNGGRIYRYKPKGV